MPHPTRLTRATLGILMALLLSLCYETIGRVFHSSATFATTGTFTCNLSESKPYRLIINRTGNFLFGYHDYLFNQPKSAIRPSQTRGFYIFQLPYKEGRYVYIWARPVSSNAFEIYFPNAMTTGTLAAGYGLNVTPLNNFLLISGNRNSIKAFFLALTSGDLFPIGTCTRT
jgi:hypothetical protein